MMATQKKEGIPGALFALALMAVSVVSVWLSHRDLMVKVETDGYGYLLPLSADRHRTLLPDGRMLEVDGLSGRMYLANGAVRRTIALPEVRRFGSVTVMPTGLVLLWGGVDAQGHVLRTGQWWDPTTERFVPARIRELPPRAGHTLTVLPDGRLLMSGGWMVQGEPAVHPILWRPRPSEIIPLNDVNDTPRFAGKADLTAEGDVRIQGGVDAAGQPLARAWVFSPPNAVAPQTVKHTDELISTTWPTAESKDVPLQGPLTLRFSRPMDMRQLSRGAVTLLGPDGDVKIEVVGTSEGRLAFIRLPDDLYPGSRYTLFVKGLHSAAGEEVPFTSIGFTTMWARTQAVSIAGQGNRRGANDTDAHTATTAPLYVMAGAGQETCPARGNTYLCRKRSFVRDGAFYPGENNAPDATGGHWRLYKAHQSLPDTRVLEASVPKRSSALIGQIRQLDETPVANVEVSVGALKARTDKQGVFLLSGVPAGRQELFVNGDAADHGDVHYGRFPVGVDIRAGKITHMRFVMYLPRVLARDEIALPSPVTRELVLTHPDMPGLEIHVPAGAVFRDRDGHVLTHIAIVPTPVDHAPFPLPDNFPMYFTIQPGDAVVQGLTPDAAKGIRIVYPNYGQAKPKTPSSFWVYDAKQDWKMYGGGHVTDDARHVAPDPGVNVVWAMGAGYAISNANPPTSKKLNNKCGGDPVDEQTGIFFEHWNDFSINDVMPLVLGRDYNSTDTASHMFGIGANSNFGIHLYSANGLNNPTLVLPCGEGIVFTALANASKTEQSDMLSVHVATPTPFYGATFQYFVNEGGSTEYQLVTMKNGTEYRFQAETSLLTSITDRFGNQLQLNYNGGLLEQVTSPSGRSITFNYDASNRVTSAVDNAGRTIGYTYNAAGNLAAVTYPDSSSEHYTYDNNNRMITMQDRRGNISITNQYDANGRVSKQTLADNTYYQFAYTTNPNNVVTATTITDPTGNQQYVTFNPVSSYPATITYGYGTSSAETVTYARQSSGLVNQITDPLGRQTTFAYDQFGNVTQMTRLANTSNPVSTQFTYDPMYSQLTSATDALGHTTYFNYTNGCLTQITNALGNSVGIQCNAGGQPVVVQDALGHAATLTYQGYDLQAISDPLGRKTTYAIDALGRRVAIQDALGNTSSFQYDTNDRIVKVINNLGQSTAINYDGNGNTLNVTLPSNAVISATYDARNRRLTRVDALNQSESWTYDGIGHVLTHTDRKHQLTQYSYDALNRLGLVTYADGSTIQGNYDAGNRLTTLADSVSGTETWTYDGLNDVTDASGPQGSISYTYDAAGRRTGMTAASQAIASYTYDNANRLTAITQGSETVQFSYDADSRRTVLTLPNEITVNYGYDAASELIGLTYTRGDGTTLGNLTYGYDEDGRVINKAGTFATDIPPTLSTQPATVDLNGRKTSFNGQAFTYDADGNLTFDGTNTYTWNARNQLLTVSQNGVAQLTYAYDALGRRISKAVQSGTPTQYLYDGLNVVQETQSSSINPILVGLGIDERFARNDVTGRTYFLADLLNSTIALSDPTGTIKAQYSYDPSGNVTSSDTTTGFTNPYQFTGREVDASGLYYYRARYYSPTVGSFISEDPLGLGGGQLSFYAYGRSDPVNYLDQTGRDPLLAGVGLVVGGGWGLINGYLQGDRNGALFRDFAVGAATGGLAGLTDGLSLGWGMTARAGIGVGMEAYREAVNGMDKGCIKFSKVDLAVAGLSSLSGDALGEVDAGQVADGLGEGIHWNPSPSDLRAAAVGGNAGGIMTAPFSSAEGSSESQ